MMKSNLSHTSNGLVNNHLSIEAYRLYFHSVFSSITTFNEPMMADKTLINEQSFSSFFDYPLIISYNIYKAVTQNGLYLTSEHITNQLAKLFSKEDRETQFFLISSILAFDGYDKEIINRDDVILIFSYFDYETIEEIKPIIMESIPEEQMTIQTLKTRAFNENSDIFILFIYYMNFYATFTVEDIEYFSDESLETYKTIAKPTEKLRNFMLKKLHAKYYMNDYDYEAYEDSSYCSDDEDLDILDCFEKDLSHTIYKIDTKISGSQFSMKRESEHERLSFSQSIAQKNILNSISVSSCNLFDSLKDNSPIQRNQIRQKHYSTSQLLFNKKTKDKDNQSSFICMISSSETNMKFRKSKLKLTNSSLIIKTDSDKTNSTTNDYSLFNNNSSQENSFQYDHIIPLHLIFAKIKGFNQQDNNSFPLIKLYPHLNRNFNDITIQLNENKESSKLINGINKYNKDFNINDYYDIIENIGRGEYCEVFIARSKKTNERVAIKRVPKKKTEDEEISNDWEKDIIRHLIKVSHNNICKMIDIHENASFVYYVSEFIKGISLRKYLNDDSYNKNAKVKESIFKQLASGIDFLHSLGIIHRDIKPENILLDFSIDQEITVKIIDFGFSKVIGKTQLCNEGYGTLVYIAPEILMKMPYSFKVDIWSYGVILYQTVFAQLPFGEDCNNMRLIAKNIKEQKYKVPHWVNNNNDNYFINRLISIINKCLGNTINDRPSKAIPLFESNMNDK